MEKNAGSLYTAVARSAFSLFGRGEPQKGSADIPFPCTLGLDVAGRVSAVGDGARVEVGQEVFGVRRPGAAAGHPHGSYAPYMTAPADTAALAPRPEGLEAVRAAALPMIGGTALALTRWLDVVAQTTTFPLAAMDEAYTAATSGHVHGKLVINTD
ncbi:alcohol dehydrogenase catalytic domain-containing protein [Streptomyces sp. NPDC054838]